MRPSFSPHTVPPKIVTQKRSKGVKFTNVGRGEHVTVVASCSASGAFVNAKGFAMYKQNLPAGTEISLTTFFLN
jgi:hypothetical protein